ncbi:MAG: hypothetical protein V3U75_05235 [Methylococcaceae bacterium]
MKVYKNSRLRALGILGLTVIIVIGCSSSQKRSDHFSRQSFSPKKTGKILDEALYAGRKADSFPAADEDYFQDMDYGISKHPKQVAKNLNKFISGISPEKAVDSIVKGRNNWIVWTGGTDRMWDVLSTTSVGGLDFLKTISSHPSLKNKRSNRWYYQGLVNEPCFEEATGPRTDRYGLWLDVRNDDCPKDPFENESKYPGVKIGARGKNIPVGSYYGYATGIIGFRLFPNPDFDEEAEKRWDPVRYYEDPEYYNDKDLVKPYRVGNSCGLCHVGPNPTNPPSDPEHPKWENLSSNPGSQYFWVDRIYSWEADETSFLYQLLHTSRPGALDTSLISTDSINNPRTMNTVYNLPERMEVAKKWGKERLEGGQKDNRQLNEYLGSDSNLSQFYQAPDTVWTPRVLKDGSDSVGALGALNRVYVNIGLFSEEWFQHFKPLAGGKKITPFTIKTAQKNSSYWNATEAQTPDLALFFLASAKPDNLIDAPEGKSYITKDTTTLQQGKKVFAETCARCHSSKLPERAFNFFPDDGCVGSNYLTCWNEYWTWTKTDEFKQQMTAIAQDEDFIKNNFMSNELRVPVTLLETNACSSLATNAIEGNIWDNFSSQSYKDLPSVGEIMVHHPVTGEPKPYAMPAGGRGYMRVPSLISLWSTAPFLQNNSVGKFYWSGSVDDRLKSYYDSIEKMLWPEKRAGEDEFMTRSGKKLPGVIDKTTTASYLRAPAGYLPDFLSGLVDRLDRFFPWLFKDGGIEIGPIPKGTPVNLISNLDLEQKPKVLKVLLKAKRDLKSLPEGVSDEEARKVFSNLVEPMLKLSNCPDFVVNRGHYFGTGYFAEESGLSDDDKHALIEFLKTM